LGKGASPIDPVTAALLLAALTPILTALGTVIAQEIYKLQERGWKL